MKNILITILFIVGIITCHAQSTKYCELICESKLVTGKSIVIIDDGTIKGAIKNADNSNREFNSIIDATNYMALDGWELVQTYIVQGNICHFVLKKSK